MSKLAIQVAKLEAARTAALASIEGIDTQLAELRPQLEAEQAIAAARQAIDVDGLPVGAAVTYAYGRAEKRRTLTGVVSAFNAETKQYRVLQGSGFDAELHTVFSKDITEVVQ